MKRTQCLLRPVVYLALVLAVTRAWAQGPVVTVLGPNPVTNECFTPFPDPGASARNVIVPIAAGYYHSVALGRDGIPFCWGANDCGQTTVPAGATDIVMVDGGFDHSVALRRDGTVIAWGCNDDGQVTVPADATNIVAVAAGSGHSLALRRDGTVIGWGYNASGQITIPAGATNAVAVAAGGSFSLALRADGTVIGWGLNADGQTTIPAGATNIVAITANSHHSLALRRDGTVLGWGWGSGVYVPADATNLVAIAAGYDHSLALRNDGTVLAWGRIWEGQTTVPPGATNIVAVAAGGYQSLAVRGDGTIFAWGDNDYGQSTVPAGRPATTAGRVIRRTAFHTDILGAQTMYYAANGAFGGVGTAARTVVVRDTTPPVLTLNGANPVVIECPGDYVEPGATATDPCVGVAAFAVGADHNLALRSDGTVVAWGSGGDGRTTVPAGATGILAVAAGGGHSLALRRDSTVIGWGENGSGQATIPAGATNAVAIAAGSVHSLALLSDGTVLGWGASNLGQIAIPAGLNNVAALAAGNAHSLALCSDGVVIGWGWGSGASVPAAATNVIAIAAGSGHSLALRGAGTVFGWGVNDYGQLNIPAGATNVAAIAAGWLHNLALRHDGTVLGWGWNGYGQTTIPAGATNIVAIGAGWGHSVALRSDGVVLAWGYNGLGETVVPGALSDAVTNITVTGVISGPTNTLTYTAVDPGGSTSVVQRTVIVLDSTPPSIAPPTNLVVYAAGSAGTVVSFPAPVVTDNCTGAVTIACLPAAGSLFPAGANTVTITATDAAGNTDTDSFTVTVVVDATPPTITPPADKIVPAGLGQCAAIGVSLGVAITGDNWGVASVTNNAPAQFPIGTNQVLWTVVDNAGLAGTATQRVVVLDLQPPTVIPPSNLVVAAAGPAGALVAYPAPVVSDNCTGAVTVVSLPASGSVFPVGTTTVTVTAADAGGCTNTCSFTITVVADTVPPAITCPTNLVVSSADPAGAIVDFDPPLASDNCTGVVSIVCLPAAGSLFPVGTNTVGITATDSAGNSNTCSFTVTVRLTPATEALTITKQKAKVNFVKPLADSASFSGLIGLPDEFAPSNQVVTVDIGGVLTEFTLDAKGKAKLLIGSCGLKRNKLGGWIVTVKLKGGTWGSAWVDDGLTDETVADRPVVLPVVVATDGRIFAGQRPLLYKASAGKGGAVK